MIMKLAGFQLLTPHVAILLGISSAACGGFTGDGVTFGGAEVVAFRVDVTLSKDVVEA